MLILRDGDVTKLTEPSVVAIGVFDGLHRGHQAVIAQLLELSTRLHAKAAVVTFDPSPAMVLNPTRAPRLIATIDQRLAGLAALGVEVVRVLTFDRLLAQLSARDFVDRVLVGELNVRDVVVGEDFHFGHNREGTVALLKEIGAEKGFDVVQAPLYGDGTRWSSTSVRRALDVGDLERATSVLGHPFTLRGVVGHGDDRGESLGYPTANLTVLPEQQLPMEGVYAGATNLNGTWWPSAISVGTRPQFYDEGELLVEVFVLGFDGDLYGLTIDVVFLSRLRAQSRFGSVEELTQQIGRDVAQTREIFEKVSNDDPELLRLNLGQRR